MNTDTLHLAPREIRLAVARALVARIQADELARSDAGERVDGDCSNGDRSLAHDRAARLLRMKDAATNQAEPVQYPEAKEPVSRPDAAEAAKPEPTTSARMRRARIYAAARSAWAAAAVRVERGGKSVAPSDTDLRTASPSRGSRRHSGMKSAFFQLSIVVSGKPVSRAISAEPPSASII